MLAASIIANMIENATTIVSVACYEGVKKLIIFPKYKTDKDV